MLTSVHRQVYPALPIIPTRLPPLPSTRRTSSHVEQQKTTTSVRQPSFTLDQSTKPIDGLNIQQPSIPTVTISQCPDMSFVDEIDWDQFLVDTDLGDKSESIAHYHNLNHMLIRFRHQCLARHLHRYPFFRSVGRP